MRIIDFFDFNSITNLLSENSLIPSLYFSVTDPEGKNLSSTRWQRVCADIHQIQPLTRSKCIKSDIILANEIKKGHEYALYSCLNNLTDAAVPIKAEEKKGNMRGLCLECIKLRGWFWAYELPEKG
jgi:Predicted histidine kinase sensor domain.